jgi:hypothetical protein
MPVVSMPCAPEIQVRMRENLKNGKNHKPKFRSEGNRCKKKKRKKMRENPPMWIEENKDENLKEIFTVAARISCKSLSTLLCFCFS